MKSRRLQTVLFTVTLVSALNLAQGAGSSQEFPSKPIKILVPQAPGALVDTLPRVLGQKITEATKQSVVVENRMGGNGAVAGAEVAKSTPDGYTLLSSFHALHVMMPHMTSKLRFDPNADLTPIVHTLSTPSILVVHPSVPAKSLRELIAYAKENPGKLTFVSQGVGSTGQVAGELLKQLAGIDIVHVPHRGAAPAQEALIAGHVTMLFDTVTSSIEHVKAGRMRALGVATAKRVDLMADVPTLTEAGLPIEMSAWFGLVAPARTPASVIAWLNREANRVFSSPEIRDRYVLQGASLPLGTPEAFGRYISAEYEKWGPVIRRANIRLD
jgi:tripartite-type tricarboxylate transporter receptor subunit TctC